MNETAQTGTAGFLEAAIELVEAIFGPIRKTATSASWPRCSPRCLRTIEMQRRTASWPVQAELRYLFAR